jgi:hypothetical protein
MTESTGSLAALSAHTSLKRARVLFDVNPYAAFVPTTDPIVAQASLERRIRRSQPPQQQQHLGLNHPGGSSSQALAVISTDGTTTAPSSSKVSSSTLTIHREDESTTDGKSSGILVVSMKGWVGNSSSDKARHKQKIENFVRFNV